ncbi:hypothetical protein LCGC14_2820570 [marine sediment metagenome]|uniref:HEPN domain-containing protein n=1 Tax=marine sediment metagenome TaxID=412755 RepID=A0A0F8YH49_9ZZZZ
MEIKDIEALIRFHKGALSEHRQFMSVSAVYLEERTIKALEELKEKTDGN